MKSATGVAELKETSNAGKNKTWKEIVGDTREHIHAVDTAIQDDLKEEFLRWFTIGGELSPFGEALLSNDLQGTLCWGTRWDIEACVNFLSCYAPEGCWGSPEAVRQWRYERHTWGMILISAIRLPRAWKNVVERYRQTPIYQNYRARFFAQKRVADLKSSGYDQRRVVFKEKKRQHKGD
jgi:hypothetical protein